ncbi:hypothetical protein PGS50_19355 [Yersinia intermedia]|uniref:hypothetical protein n=2 Tax=Yersinia intermedia TaxID=631 RepID=UPI0022FE00A2|nr:hypothetical protein [Yersinia intermedia]MDA5495395.1 hypothetical protein [Yersinia intermedia]
MGVELISVGSVAPWYTKVSPPVIRGLEGWFCFDTDISRIAFNRAPGKSDAVIVGLPEVNGSFTRFKSLSNYLNTNIPESVEMTVFIVGKSPVAIGEPSVPANHVPHPMYFGNYPGGNSSVSGYTTYGCGMFNDGPARLAMTASRISSGTGSATSAQASITTDNPTAWGLRVARFGEMTKTRVQNLTTGAFGEYAATTQRLPSVNPLRIGGAYSTFSGEVDISQIVIYSAALTDEEIAAVASLMRVRSARLGITV